jgi:hypothetical protein
MGLYGGLGRGIEGHEEGRWMGREWTGMLRCFAGSEDSLYYG